MKLTESKLRQIIREEAQKLNEADKVNLTKNETWIVNFLKKNYKKGEYVSPTTIGKSYGDETKGAGKHHIHSSWATPIAKRMVAKGVLKRNNKGWYVLV